MIIGTALGFSDLGTIALAVALAFLFGYGLTSLPLLRSGMALAAVVPIALATDTFSIADMEIVDNGLMLAIPGAMHAGVGDVLFWGALSFALVVAGVVAFPVNRWLIPRGKGHAVLHETGIHGGPPTRVVAAIAAVAFVFGSTVLVAEAFGGDDEPHGGDHPAAAGAGPGARPGRLLRRPDAATRRDRGAARARARSSASPSSTRTAGPCTDFEEEHERRLHLIVARRDGTGFQHLHPTLGRDGAWTAPITLREAGNYRVFADFKRDGQNETLGADLAVDGDVDWRPLPPPPAPRRRRRRLQVASTRGARARAASPSCASPSRATAGPSQVEPYLGAGGHLVALREGDLAYLHVHPTEGGGGHGETARTGTRARDPSPSPPSSRPRAATGCSSSSSTTGGSTPPPSPRRSRDESPPAEAARPGNGRGRLHSMRDRARPLDPRPS